MSLLLLLGIYPVLLFATVLIGATESHDAAGVFLFCGAVLLALVLGTKREGDAGAGQGSRPI